MNAANTPAHTQVHTPNHTGSCHCRAVKFEVRTTLLPATHCNCSLCKCKDALMSPVFSVDDLHIVEGAEALAMYQFNMRAAQHFSYKICGIYPFHQTRKDARLWRVNLGCLDGGYAYAPENIVADGTSLSVVEDA